MRIIWALLAVLGICAGVGALMSAVSDIQIIVAALGFNFAAICGTNELLGLLVARVTAQKPPTIPAPQPPADMTPLVELLTHIKAELQWQRAQKEKEILRARAALAKRDGQSP